MNTKTTTSESIDELVVPLRTELTRRALIKKLGAGAGGVAIASIAGRGAADAATAWPAQLHQGALRIRKSGSIAKVGVYYTLQLRPVAVSEIRRGRRYGIWFTIYHAGDNKRVHAWSSGPLPAQEWFVHSTSQRLKWNEVRQYGSVFYATMTVFKRKNGRRVRVSRTFYTPYFRLGA